MRTVDIDALDPGYTSEPPVSMRGRRSSAREKVSLRRTTYVNVGIGAYRHVLGVRPETMRDWRGIERRLHQLDVAWHAAHDALWARLRAFERSPGDDGSAVVLISDPGTGDDEVIRVSKDGYSHDDMARMVESLVSNPLREGKFRLHRYDEGGRELSRLLKRESRLHRAFGAYRLAFERAVIDRLRAFGEARRGGVSTFYEPAVVIVVNDDRTYAFHLNNRGVFSHLSCDVFTSGG